MFIFPPFNKIILKYTLSKQTDTSLGEIGPSDLLGTRNDGDKEHARLYRAMSRRIQRSGLVGLVEDDRFSLEVQRYHEKHSREPQQLRELQEIRARLDKVPGLGMISSTVAILFFDGKNYGEAHQRVEGILQLLNDAEEIALKARAGKNTNNDLFRMPWLHLGPKILRQPNEEVEDKIERFVSCDVVLFLWVVALIATEMFGKNINIDEFIPAKYENLGRAWFNGLEGFASKCHCVGATKAGPTSRYNAVADFLVSGDPDGGPLETLAEELSEVDRGKKRLTKRVVSRHVGLLTTALEIFWDEQPQMKAMAESMGTMLNVHGEILGLLQYARAVVLSEVQQEYPSANLEAAFDAGLVCWPSLIEWARLVKDGEQN